MPITPSMTAVLYASAILAIFMWFCGTVTTYVRGRSLEGPNREDGLVMNFFNLLFFVRRGALAVLPDNSEKSAAVNRWIRITNNNTANIPPALIVFFLASLFGTLNAGTLVLLVWIFVGSRLLHTLCYALALQPFRTAAYAVGSTCMVITAISLVAGA